MPMYEAKAPQTLSPVRLDKFISQALPQLPQKAVREAFCRRDVKMNGKRCPKEAIVEPGAVVQVFTPWKGEELDIVYEDDQILLINKRAGISVTADESGAQGVLQLAASYLEKKGEEPPLLCHRLDNQTSGLLLLAKNAEAEASARQAFFDRTMEKQYTCLVKGTPKPESAVLEAYLVKDAANARVKVITKPWVSSQPIKTGYQVVEAGEISRLKVDLYTGRTHQIRAHLAFINHPILGDDAYGDRAFNRNHKGRRLMLCATKLTFRAEGCLAYLNGKTFEIKAPF